MLALTVLGRLKRNAWRAAVGAAALAVVIGGATLAMPPGTHDTVTTAATSVPSAPPVPVGPGDRRAAHRLGEPVAEWCHGRPLDSFGEQPTARHVHQRGAFPFVIGVSFAVSISLSHGGHGPDHHQLLAA